ncbi:flippase [Desulfosarcina ovata]|uniref:Uncharacterized protein n=1 Tax=Desulfosarcina ovata subsp. ovata TaxID=2752305 RepID=A0A5K8A552_9BACT|nr:flippase [Desulfosarcina ovata]BBO87713.1 hypothetical protein DSCOOX_08930 [Desulfosarcina ovata subsp. ovata]
MAVAILKKILQNSMFLIAGRLFSRAMQFVLFVYAARQLGVATFGLFSFAYATVNLFAITMDLGLSSYLVQQLSRKQQRLTTLLFQAMWLKAILIPLGLAIILISGSLLATHTATWWPLILLGIAAAVDSITSLFYAVFHSRQQMQYSALVIATSNGIMSLVGLALLFFYPVVGLLCGIFALGAVLRCILAAMIVRRKIELPEKRSDDRFATEMLAKAFPFALVTIFVTIYYYIDTLILTAFSSAEVVGHYNAAYRLLEAPQFIVQAVTTALFPAASSFYNHDRSELRHLTAHFVQKAAAFGISVAIVTAYVADELVYLLYGSAYSASGPLLAVLIISAAIIMPNTICGTTLRATDHQNISAVVTGLGAFLNIGLNLAVVPQFEALGAAWATVATEGFVLVVYFFLVWRWVGPLFSFTFLLRLVLIGLLWMTAMTATRPLGVVAQVGAAVVLFFPFLIASGIFKTKELKKIMQRKAPS